MKLTYIYHSGFALETASCILIFDFFKDSISLHKGVVHDVLLKSNKPIYILSSHSHADHYNKEILNWKSQSNSINYIFSKEILDAGLVKNDDAVFLDKLETYTDDILSVQAFGSTDLGGSFLVKCDGKTIFHAGDLNNWHWDEESTPQEINEAESLYLNELNLLAEHTSNVAIAMFPVDARLGKNYMKGAQQFIDTIKVGLFAPMHFGQGYNEGNAFKEYAEKNGCRFFEIHEKGDTINY